MSSEALIYTFSFTDSDGGNCWESWSQTLIYDDTVETIHKSSNPISFDAESMTLTVETIEASDVGVFDLTLIV